MKRKILYIFAIISVLSLAIAAFAYGGLNVTSADDKVSCCKKDSCPMKGEQHKSGDHAKGEHRCCGDSCPMKGENHKSGDHAKMEGHNCCGDSCPMKSKKDGVVTTTGASATEAGKGCCENCECCKGKAKTEDKAV